jgi:hypothetical protein
MCQLGLNSNKINNVDVTHVLNAEHRDTTESLINECKSEKRTNYELELLTIEKAQQNDVNIKKIFYFAKAREIDVYVARSGIPFR